MKDCYIFCAGEWDGSAVAMAEDAVVIAADGGLRHTRALGLVPDVILGDFDSLGFTPEEAEAYPVEKDDTDTMLAAKRALAMGCSRLWFLASLDGERLDHTVANFQTLAWLKKRQATGYLVGKHQIAALLTPGTYRFSRESRGEISLFSWGSQAAGITLEGLKYTLTDGSLTDSFPLGVSNSFTGEPAQIRLKQGALLAIWNRAAGIPEKLERR